MNGKGLKLNSSRLTINANNYVFWFCLCILATPGLADRVREETKLFFSDVPNDIDHKSFDASGSAGTLNPTESDSEVLRRSCPLLKACYLEKLRLDCETRSVRKTRNAHMVHEYGSTATESKSSFELKPGDYLHVFHYLHHSGPKYFEDSNTYRPERFLVPASEPGFPPTVDQKTLRPYGAGSSMCKGRVIAERFLYQSSSRHPTHLGHRACRSWGLEDTRPYQRCWIVQAYAECSRQVHVSKEDVKIMTLNTQAQIALTEYASMSSRRMYYDRPHSDSVEDMFPL